MALRDLRSGLRLPTPVWDGPTRLVHWSLLLVAAASAITAWRGPPEWHVLAGYLLLALLLFRLGWGLVGSDTARLARMISTPAAVLRELGKLADRGPDDRAGPGPATGWLGAIMLLSLAVQAGSGLALLHGGGEPLLRLHRISAAVLAGAVVLHVLVVGAYAVLRRHDLVRPMLNGRKRLPAAAAAPRMVGAGLALLVLVVAASLAWLLAAWPG